MTHVVILFLDGVGLGAEDPKVNPLVAARMPVLEELLGRMPLVAGSGSIDTPGAIMQPTDASLGIPGRPQSATGQTALLTGQNAPQLVGGHYGPRPNAALRQMLEGETLFSRALAAGHAVAFANAYPAGYFAAIQRGKRLHGAIPHAAQAAGLPLRTAEDLAAGRALSVDLTNAAWRNGLGYPDMPELTPAEAGAVMARLARDHSLAFFDQWATDMVGHQGDHAAAVRVLEEFDSFLGGLLHGVDLARTLVLITSDHGNIEDLSQRGHTQNRVPTILIGANRHVLAAQIADLTDITPGVLRVLEGPGQSTA
jgi:2,3-bisphosphoglycerate-independent phosphoglycerate mutase